VKCVSVIDQECERLKISYIKALRVRVLLLQTAGKYREGEEVGRERKGEQRKEGDGGRREGEGKEGGRERKGEKERQEEREREI
jgi:hypothetical protein